MMIVMIVMSVLGVLAADPGQVGRPSVLPPLDSLPGGRRPAGDGVGANCELAGVVPGKPVPKKLLRARSDPTKLRVVRRGDQITMDLVPDRLNIHVDEQGNVTHITCG